MKNEKPSSATKMRASQNETSLCKTPVLAYMYTYVACDYSYCLLVSRRTPWNSYRCLLGGSHWMLARKFINSAVSKRLAVSVWACRIFRFVSPSRFAVSIKDIPCGSDDDSNIKSAGKKVLL